MTGLRLAPRRGRASRVRWASTLLASLAVLLQAFVVQTHVHGLAGQDTGVSIALFDGGQPPTNNGTAPNHRNQQPCLICQALATGASAVVSATPTFAPLTHALRAEPVAEVALIATRPSHAWQSRAPPTAL
jgi:hypothetical protein